MITHSAYSLQHILCFSYDGVIFCNESLVVHIQQGDSECRKELAMLYGFCSLPGRAKCATQRTAVVPSCDKCVTQRTDVVNCPFGWISAHFRAVEVFEQMSLFEFVIFDLASLWWHRAGIH